MGACGSSSARAPGRARLAVVLAAVAVAVLAAVADLALAAPPQGAPATAAARAPTAAAGPNRAASSAARPKAPPAATARLGRSGLRAEITAALRSVGGADGAWVFDIDASGDGLLFADDATRRLVPASNQKLFTTAAFLAEFGPTHRLQTRAYARGQLRRDGRLLAGDLVVVGDGDPAFGTAGFARRHSQPVTRVSALANAIVRTGLRRITGRVRADDSIFDRKRHAGPYLTPLSGLSYNNGLAGGGYASNPELIAAKQLAKALRKRGVRVGRQVGRAKLSRRARASRPPLASVSSPPVAALIAETNEASNNFFAEMLLKRLGATNGRKGTRKRGARRVERFARRVGSGVRAADGSGLSRRNAASPQEIGRLLVAIARNRRLAAPFFDSLALAGREGTLDQRMEGTAAAGRCAGKTGTLSGVSALSGYCRTGGHTIAFATLFNNTDVIAARRAQDRIATAIARYDP